jgi:hypothetical protein
MYFDDLPVWGFVGRTEKIVSTQVRSGAPRGGGSVQRLPACLPACARAAASPHPPSFSPPLPARQTPKQPLEAGVGEFRYFLFTHLNFDVKYNEDK